MDTTGIPVKLTPEKIIEGNNPIVIIGPNGPGKTRFGVDLANSHNAEIIGALRNTALEDNISMQSLEQATQHLTSQLTNQRSQYWALSNEINHLFSKLLAEDSASAIKVRDALLDEQQVIIEKTRLNIENTRLMQLRKAWQELFPGRDIKFETYSPKVQTSLQWWIRDGS